MVGCIPRYGSVYRPIKHEISTPHDVTAPRNSLHPMTYKLLHNSLSGRRPRVCLERKALAQNQITIKMFKPLHSATKIEESRSVHKQIHNATSFTRHTNTGMKFCYGALIAYINRKHV